MAGELLVVVRRHLDLVALGPVVTRGAAVTVDLGALIDVDLATVDALSRLHLAATRAGGRLLLRNVPPALAELVALAGLTGVLSA
jgi:anti-anti-sigma regulatory factor